MNSRKYQRYFRPISSRPFSTAGTIRNQGWVGQTSLSRSLVHTPFRGEYAVGYGANPVTGYPISTVFSCCNGSNSDGQTSMTNKGLLLSRVAHPTSVYNESCDDRKCPKAWFKNTSPEYHSQGSLTRRNVNKLMALHYNEMDGAEAAKYGPPAVSSEGPLPFAKNVAPMSSGDYMRTALPYKVCMDVPTVCKPAHVAAYDIQEYEQSGGYGQII